MLIFYLVLALGVSFLCSLFEAVILSATPGFAAALASDGKPGGKLLLELKNNVEDSLSAILTLNTIAHTIGAAGVGAEILKIFGNSAVAIGSAILTLLILVLSEIIPKTIGASYWRSIARPVARGIQLFIWITYPFVISFKFLSRMIGGKKLMSITPAELIHSAELGQQEGALSEKELGVIKNMLRLRAILVEDIMTPRTVVFALSKELTITDVVERHAPIRFSRIPIFDENVDDIIGKVTRYEILAGFARGDGQMRLADLVNPIYAVTTSTAVSDLLEELVARHAHILAVYDIHGGFAGVVTLEDAIETLLGLEIVDETDAVADMRLLARQKWAKRRAALLGLERSALGRESSTN